MIDFDQKFIVKDHFKVGNSKVKISHIGDKFTHWFGDKIEEPNYQDKEPECETMLWEVFCLLEKQPNGEDGILLTKNVHTNVFYVDDVYDILRATTFYWNIDGWSINAFSVEWPYEGWLAKRRRFHIIF